MTDLQPFIVMDDLDRVLPEFAKQAGLTEAFGDPRQLHELICMARATPTPWVQVTHAAPTRNIYDTLSSGKERFA